MSEAPTIRQSAIAGMIDNCALRVMHDYGIGTVQKDRGKTTHQLFVGNCFHLAYADAHRDWIATDIPPDCDTIVDRAVSVFNSREVAPNEAPVEEVDWGDKNEGSHLVDLITMINAYYPHFLRTPAQDVEVRLSREIEGINITTALDIITKNGWIGDFKTSSVQYGRGGKEYFAYWNEGIAKVKSQPFIHLLLYGKPMPYFFEVVGKGQQALVERIIVPHSREAITQWKELVLIPVIHDILAGRFPARPGKHCDWCKYGKTSECGVLL